MRRFIVTNPNLSIAKAGTVVEADQLRMDDEKLDEWVAAGFGMELFDDWNYAPAETESFIELTEPKRSFEAADEVEQFDPGEHTVERVLDHLSKHPDDTLRVVEAEVMGKNRSTIVNVGR